MNSNSDEETFFKLLKAFQGDLEVHRTGKCVFGVLNFDVDDFHFRHVY